MRFVAVFSRRVCLLGNLNGRRERRTIRPRPPADFWKWVGGGPIDRFHRQSGAPPTGRNRREVQSLMFKLLFRTGVLAAAVVGPMLFFSVSDIWAGAKKASSSLAGVMHTSKDSTPTASISAETSTSTLEGPAVRDFGEIIRFDVTTAWVMSRWARVSTGMAQLQLQGYRVPLVTGTAKDDLAGALTYYFGPEQRVRKITFNGTTGDATRLVRLLTTQYGFRRRMANDSGLFVYEAPNREGGVRSVLRIRPTGVVKANQPYQRFQVDLLLEQPEKG
jgi:hypothetical protein